MNRREALKGLGISLGYIAVTPTVISLLQSCKKDVNTAIATKWIPVFFTQEQGVVVENLVNLMLPNTGGLPGAGDVNVVKFIDLYAAKVINKDEQKEYKNNINALIDALKKPVKKLTTQDYNNLLAKYLKASDKEKEAFNKNEKAVLETLLGLRGMSIWGYRNSRLVGTEVLAYDPTPGSYDGCISLEDATGGRLWSL